MVQTRNIEVTSDKVLEDTLKQISSLKIATTLLKVSRGERDFDWPEDLIDMDDQKFNLMDKFGPVISKWANKSETYNPSRTKKSRVNEIIDPSVVSNILSFAAESQERKERMNPVFRLTDELLGRQFRGSSIFTDAEDKRDSTR